MVIVFYSLLLIAIVLGAIDGISGVVEDERTAKGTRRWRGDSVAVFHIRSALSNLVKYGRAANRHEIQETNDKPWRRPSHYFNYQVVASNEKEDSRVYEWGGPPIAADPLECPWRLDAITHAANRRLYAFKDGHCYESWRDSQGLHQKSVIAHSS